MKLKISLLVLSCILSACAGKPTYYSPAPYTAQYQISDENIRKQLEKEGSDRAAYYASPQGKTDLTRQQMLAEQQAMQQQIAAQQRQMYEAQQWNQINQQIQNMNQSIQQSNQQMMQMYNNRTKNVSCYNAFGNVNCYSY